MYKSPLNNPDTIAAMGATKSSECLQRCEPAKTPDDISMIAARIFDKSRAALKGVAHIKARLFGQGTTFPELDDGPIGGLQRTLEETEIVLNALNEEIFGIQNNL